MDVLLPNSVTIPAEVWHVAIILGLGLLVSILTQFIKSWLSSLGEKRITAILTAFSGVAGFIEVLVANLQANPLILGQNTALIVGVATLSYRYIVKPITNLLIDAKAMRVVDEHMEEIIEKADDAPSVDPSPVLTPEVVEEKRPVGQYADF